MSTAARAGKDERPEEVSAHDAQNLPPPAERGATVIPDRVVARIAAKAASTALHRMPGPQRLLAELAAPGARATTYHGTTQLALTVDLPYPTDLGVTCRQLQREVTEQVARLTGLDISEVTLTVRRLVVARQPGRVR
ncbi:Asp23/Gls24 family envelope stress response protein [Streptomyces fagopyri]|uniref:Asp23/Gls24 family envelope stress response protein n=1 Tax=Streptomyces fagopyri TaxID=2662397 RepID=UPI00340F86F1